MNQRRGRLEIIKDILAAVHEVGESKKTRVMQKAYLDWRNFQRYFDFLVENGFLNVKNNGGDKVYMLSENGRILLDKLNELDMFIESCMR